MKNTVKTSDNWNQIKGKLRQKYFTLTENDLLLTDGKKDELYVRLQMKLGKTKEEVRELISGLYI